MIKVLHTSDWHLGKRLFKESRLEEQIQFLEWLDVQIEKEQPHYFVLPGDIFDTPSPPHEALSLFTHFLKKLEKYTTTQFLIIAGNHDSGTLLESLRALLPKNIKVVGKLSSIPKDHLIHYPKNKNHSQDINFILLPYFRSNELEQWRKYYGEDLSSEEVLGHFFQDITKDIEENEQVVLLAHHNFGKVIPAGSEHHITLSGVESIDLKWIKQKFNYLALGHIHKPQIVSKTPLGTYSGSPLPMRFSEREEKFLNLVTLSPDKETNLRKILIPKFRLLSEFKGRVKELIQFLENIDTTSTLRPWIGLTLIIDYERGFSTSELVELEERYAVKFLYIRYELEEHKKEESPPKELPRIEDSFLAFFRSKNSGQAPNPTLMRDFSRLIEICKDEEYKKALVEQSIELEELFKDETL